MLKDEYIRRFDKAAHQCRDFAQSFLIEILPLPIRFDIRFVGAEMKKGKVKFLGGRLVKPEELISMEYVKARRWLWVDGRVPRWVDFHVARVEPQTTIIQVNLAHDLHSDESKLYHEREGNPPFHVLSPPLPPYGWKRVLNAPKRDPLINQLVRFKLHECAGTYDATILTREETGYLVRGGSLCEYLSNDADMVGQLRQQGIEDCKDGIAFIEFKRIHSIQRVTT